MLGNTLHGNWESPCLPTGKKSGLHWEVQGRKPMINGQGQSDGDIVPEKSPNKSQEAEGVRQSNWQGGKGESPVIQRFSKPE